jgi:hypothetical protein
LIAAVTSGLCLPTVVCPSQIVDGGSGLATSVASQAASSVLKAVGDGLFQAASYVLGHLIDLILTSAGPDLGAKWFVHEMTLMRQVMLAVVLPILMAATIGPVLRQDGRRLFRVWGIGLPLALFAGLAGSQFTGWGLRWTDALCGLFLGGESKALAAQFTHAVTNSAVTAAPLFVQMLVAALTLSGAVLVWLELVVRSAGVYVTTFFMPLVLVAYIWPATAGMAKRALEILVSLILAKFVIVACLSLGAAALAGSGVDSAVSGAGILLMAGFAPFALLRLAPIVEASAIAHLEGLSRRPARAAMQATAAAGAHPVTQLVMANATARSGSAGADGGLATRLVTGPPLPQPAPDYPIPTGAGRAADG